MYLNSIGAVDAQLSDIFSEIDPAQYISQFQELSCFSQLHLDALVADGYLLETDVLPAELPFSQRILGTSHLLYWNLILDTFEKAALKRDKALSFRDYKGPFSFWLLAIYNMYYFQIGDNLQSIAKAREFVLPHKHILFSLDLCMDIHKESTGTTFINYPIHSSKKLEVITKCISLFTHDELTQSLFAEDQINNRYSQQGIKIRDIDETKELPHQSSWNFLCQAHTRFKKRLDHAWRIGWVDLRHTLIHSNLVKI